MKSAVKLLRFYDQIAHFLSERLLSEEYFCCVYGSYPALRDTSQSDIDLYVAVPKFDKALLNELTEFIMRLHSAEGLNQDDEVPFYNKLLVSYCDVAAAVDLEPFLNEKKLHVTPIEKSKEFLSSSHIRQRLIFNAFTTPHDYIAGNRLEYLQYRMRAEQGLYRLAVFLSPSLSPTIEKMVEALIYDEHGNSGEWFLGYKDYDTIRAYLSFLLLKYHA